GKAESFSCSTFPNLRMREIHVLVIFACDNGAMERLCLQAAVGAVQARAAIRLRRVASAREPNPESLRMDQDYVDPRPGDFDWADGFVFSVSPERLGLESPAVAGKKSVTLLPYESVEGESGDHVVTTQTLTTDDALRLGRRLVEAIRAETE